ncbi:hypothetical protein ACT3SP_04435 [Brachybacterium sp. AOP43-C2-M15]|uniref:hypothetical protein n=1 Tax=Brachybacterium sp. AOP43-C2-M15 TaxID=3457661 RepID=UPI0040349EA2
MESHHELPIGHELQAATSTGPIPAVPATSDAGEQQTSWRTTVAVILALVLALAVITIVGL